MSKGRRLIDHLDSCYPILDSLDNVARNSHHIKIIRNMTDEMFDRIVNQDDR